MRNAPSMTGLRVLEAVVRTGSLSAAARELCVTPAAISHRLRDLQVQSGAALVYRSGGRFGATQLGQTVLAAVGDAFHRIRAADDILNRSRHATLRIVASYSFAVLWLAPRLSRFQAMHPEATLFLEPSHSPTDQANADVLILHAAQAPETAAWTRLFVDRCAAVAQAAHPFFQLPDARPCDVLAARLVHVSHGGGPELGEFSWHQWSAALALPGPIPKTGATVTAEHLAVDLVLAEESFALIGLVNATRLIGQGRLRAVPDSATATGCSYWASVTENASRGLATEFLAWLQDQLACEAEVTV